MATSIEQSVNWRNVTKKPDYQVAARQVDTFVQPQQNTRGLQVAKALGQVSGDLGQLAARKAQENQKAIATATALQKDQARVAATREAALFNEAQKSENYNENSSYESVFSSVYSDPQAQDRYNNALNAFKDNPEALGVFENTLRMSTEAPLIKAIGESVMQQRSDAIAGLLPAVYQEALTKTPNNKEVAFRSTEAQLFKRLTDPKNKGGYGMKNTIAAEMLGNIFLSETLKRDSDGRANTFMAEQYILSGKGSNEMRDKLTTAILNQQRYAAQERGVKRTEQKIEEDQETKSIITTLMSGEYKTSDSNILARNDLTDDQKITLVGINTKVKEQQRIAADPTRKAEAKKLLLKTKRDLKSAAITGDFTEFGFAEGQVPTPEELEAKLTDRYLGQMANENDFNVLVASAANSLSINDYIDSEGSDKVLRTKYKQLQGQFDSKRFTRNMRKYSQEVLDNQPVETYLTEEFKRVTHELVEDYVSSGKDLTSAALSLIYDQASTQVMTPITEYATSSYEDRKEILNNASSDNNDDSSNLIQANAQGLEKWDEYSKLNNGYPSEDFLAKWDAQGLARPVEEANEANTELKDISVGAITDQIAAVTQELVEEYADDNSPLGTFGKRSFEEEKAELEAELESLQQRLIETEALSEVEILTDRLRAIEAQSKPRGALRVRERNKKIAELKQRLAEAEAQATK